MKERPIIFNGEMVRAVLAGRKTQTRRVVTQVIELRKADSISKSDWLYRRKDGLWENVPDDRFIEKWCPYGKPGDRLWVRETWNAYSIDEQCLRWDQVSRGDREVLMWECVYRASAKRDHRWITPIHMPRWASRITLEVTSVRVNTIHNISRYDVEQEGVVLSEDDDSWSKFIDLWDSINKKRGFGWDTNPWVWVVEFRLLEDSNAST